MSPSTPKTVPTSASVRDFIAAVADQSRRADCQALLRLMTAKVCLYLKRLADVDAAVLQQLVKSSVADMAAQRVVPSNLKDKKQ